MFLLKKECIHRFIQSIRYRWSFDIAKKTRKERCQNHESCLVSQLLKWKETVYKNQWMYCYSTKIYQVHSAVSPNTGTVLFLLYVNDLPNSSIVLVPLMFAEDTSFFPFLFFVFLSTVTKTHYLRQLMKNWLRSTNGSAVT